MEKEGHDWQTVRAEERARAARRRDWVRATGWACPLPVNDVGLALSGGGIRSATFSLGFMKSLSQAGLIHSIDYLSTVSGGGYAGSFYCSLFVPNALRGRAPPGGLDQDQCPVIPAALGRDVLGSPIGREAVSQLRQGGHYLAPNGTSDALFAGVIAIRNWFAVAITTGLALLGIFFFVNFAVSAAVPLLSRTNSYASQFGITPDEYGAWRMMLTAMALWPAACAWAFWFARSGAVPRSRWARPFSMQLVVATLIFLLVLFWPGSREGWHGLLRSTVLAITVLSVLVYVLAEMVTYWTDRREGSDGRTIDRVEALAQEDRVRNLLGRWLLFGTLAFVSVGLLALVYWVARERIWRGSASLLGELGWPGTGATAVGTALIGAMYFSRWLLRRESENPVALGRFALAMPRLRRLVALVAGMMLLAAFVTFWAAMAVGASEWIKLNVGLAWANIGNELPELVAWFKRSEWGAKAPDGFEANMILLVLSLIILLIAYLLGNVDSILNRSSLSAFYSSRLRTAYLGATNMRRWDRTARAAGTAPGLEQGKAVDADDANDEITLAAYFDDSVMAPIHLINVTINETTSKSSRVIQRDRKGKSMTVAPSGYLYPPGSPSRPLTLVRRELAEDLPLSSWMAISGAAFTTGAGHHTSLGTAMLAGLTNMRLGYWWRRSRPRRWGLRRPAHLVQRYLLRELWASYEGTEAERWYLSDGGHYENTGVYELVRRRVPFIIASDNGADPNYEFSDLVSLIRKLRIDFEAEVEFVDEDELEELFGETPLRDVFGTLEEIQSTGKQAAKAAANPARSQPKAGPYATLARVHYHGLADALADARNGTPPSTLLLIKPRVTGRELPDLLQYRQANAAFPQQPTTNQFFDEAQWESYYRLGQLIGDAIFDKKRFRGETAGAKWQPWKLAPLPAPGSRRRSRRADPLAAATK